MGVSQTRHILVLLGKFCQHGDDIEQLSAHDFQTLAHNDDVGVISNIAAGCTQMDDSFCIWTLAAIGVHMAHHIVTNQLLTLTGDFIVNLVLVGFQLCNLLVGDVDAQCFFCLGKGNPKLSPGFEFVVLRKYILHLLACVAGREGTFIRICAHLTFLHLSLYKSGNSPVISFLV